MADLAHVAGQSGEAATAQLSLASHVALWAFVVAVVPAATLLRWGYQVTHDQDVRRRCLRWGWPLSALAVVLVLVFLATEPATHAR